MLMSIPSTITIVTRTSSLALWQANFVKDKLRMFYPSLQIEILGIKTAGDKWLETPLYEIGGKSLFVKELEQALLTKQADLAVHSLKDLPAVFPEGLGLAAICPRESPFDAWICPSKHSVMTLPSGSKVGTSSLRRIVQLKQLRPDLIYEPLRGNVDSRIQKCLSQQYDAIVLAHAGLKRLNLESYVTEVFSAEQMLPAVGQGALGIECRSEDTVILELLKGLHDSLTAQSVGAERAMNAKLGGSCQVAVAGYARWHQGQLHLTGRVGCPQSAKLLEAKSVGKLTQYQQIGEEVANQLIDQGAQSIIEASYQCFKGQPSTK